MSNAPNFGPRRSPATDDVRRVLGPLDGGRIPGGCNRCDAYQSVTFVEDGVWKITVHHDDWCPWWSSRSNR